MKFVPFGPSPGLVWIVDARGHTPLPTHARRSGMTTVDYAWGDCSQGAARLAFAILQEVLGDVRRAAKMMPDFTRGVIATLKGDAWELTSEQVLQFVTETETLWGK